MKKIVLLAAFSLLGSSLMSCDNETTDANGNLETFATDDGFIPPIPPTKPPKP